MVELTNGSYLCPAVKVYLNTAFYTWESYCTSYPMRYEYRLILYEEIILKGVGRPNFTLFLVFLIRQLSKSTICHESLSDLIYCFINGTHLTMGGSATAKA